MQQEGCATGREVLQMNHTSCLLGSVPEQGWRQGQEQEMGWGRGRGTRSTGREEGKGSGRVTKDHARL